MVKKLSRRDFIKLGLGAGTSFTISPFFNSCATVQNLIESQEEVDAQLESHPAFPIPKGQCYIGIHEDIAGFYVGFPGQYESWKKQEVEAAEKSIENYEETFGHIPAVQSFSDRHIGVREDFPTNIIVGAHNKGVMPLIRYYPRTSWKRIAQGAQDSDLEHFAEAAVECGREYLFVPFPEASQGNPKGSHPWRNWDPKFFKKAWDRMYSIKEKRNANKLAVWGLHLIGNHATMEKPMKYFFIEPEQVNLVGVSYWYNPDYHKGKSFGQMVGPDYHALCSQYETKPFVMWELGVKFRNLFTSSHSQKELGKWIQQTYESLPKFPRIKLVVFYKFSFQIKNWYSFIYGESIPYYKRATAIPYFLKGG